MNIYFMKIQTLTGGYEKQNHGTYCHSVSYCVVTHLRENLAFPVDPIANMKTSSWNHLFKINTTFSNNYKDKWKEPSNAFLAKLTSLYKLNRSRRLALSIASGNSASPPWGMRRLCPRSIKNCITSFKNSSCGTRRFMKISSYSPKVKRISSAEISQLQNPMN